MFEDTGFSRLNGGMKSLIPQERASTRNLETSNSEAKS